MRPPTAQRVWPYWLRGRTELCSLPFTEPTDLTVCAGGGQGCEWECEQADRHYRRAAAVHSESQMRRAHTGRHAAPHCGQWRCACHVLPSPPPPPSRPRPRACAAVPVPGLRSIVRYGRAERRAGRRTGNGLQILTKTILSRPHERFFSSLVFATVAHSAPHQLGTGRGTDARLSRPRLA